MRGGTPRTASREAGALCGGDRGGEEVQRMPRYQSGESHGNYGVIIRSCVPVQLSNNVLFNHDFRRSFPQGRDPGAGAASPDPPAHGRGGTESLDKCSVGSRQTSHLAAKLIFKT